MSRGHVRDEVGNANEQLLEIRILTRIVAERALGGTVESSHHVHLIHTVKPRTQQTHCITQACGGRYCRIEHQVERWSLFTFRSPCALSITGLLPSLLLGHCVRAWPTIIK